MILNFTNIYDKANMTLSNQEDSMLLLARNILGRLLKGVHKSGNSAAAELSGMGPRELCDLGIGASEIPYTLAGGRRSHQGPDALTRGNMSAVSLPLSKGLNPANPLRPPFIQITDEG
jgi:hypothetical protein